MSTVNQHKFYFPNLDALRYIAFLFVFMAHTYQKFFDALKIDNFFLNKIINFFFRNGGMGVSIFFVLSGFLITYGILTEVKDTGSLNLKNFFIKRSFRIWPLYFLLILFGFVIYPLVKVYLLHIQYYTCANPLNHIFFLSNFDSIYVLKHCMDYGISFQGITWSVSIEEQFYLVWPFLFFLMPVNYYKYAIYLVLFICILFRILNINDYYILYYHTLSVMGDLAMGALVAYYSIYNKNAIPLLNKIKPALLYILYIAGLLILIFIHDEKYFMSPILTRLYSITYFSFIIATQNFHRSPPFPLSKLKLFSHWGKYTYGLYLFHLVVYYFAGLVLAVLHLNTSPILYHLLLSTFTFIFSMILCYLLYEYFEKYFLRMRNKFLV